MKDLSSVPFDNIGFLFQESFSYRINYFKKALEAEPDSVKAKEDYQWMRDALDELENQFYTSDFWYCEYDYIGVGHI